MDELALRCTTGEAEIDRLLCGFVRAFEAAFPGQVRCYLLAGSYAEGTATDTSDLDLDVVLKDEHDDPRLVHRAGRLLRACDELSPVHLDAGATWEGQYPAYQDSGDIWAARSAVARRVYARLAKPVLYGDDFRRRILLPAVEDWTRALVRDAVGRLGWLRGSPARLIFPLAYPDPHDPVFGYARYRCRARNGTVHETTRLLVRAVLDAANAMVAWRVGRYVTRKQDVAGAYREAVGDCWAPLVEAVDRTCRVELAYLVPGHPAGAHRLREVCAAALAFENHFLSWCRRFVLDDLAQAMTDERWLPAELAGWLIGCAADEVQALAERGGLPARIVDGRRQVAARPCLEVWGATMLGLVVYPGEAEVLHRLAALRRSAVPPVRRAAASSLAATTSAG